MAAPRCVAVDDHVLGWAALAPFSDRSVFDGVAEVSVYIASSARGEGVGETLLTSLVRQAEHEGIWTVQAGAFPENEGSRSMLEACGFRQGRRP